MEWIRSAAAAPCIASVCTGSLLLGAAGLLRRRRATTHSSASEELAGSCAEVSRERICGRRAGGDRARRYLVAGPRAVSGGEVCRRGGPRADSGADGLPVNRIRPYYSHSMVPGGLCVRS
ncbi:MAG: DJ-1/PfpI family protein [Bryobacteraceae bacterium]|nr:DJ-1/PfpI family protein [Bryobacteraceae bacterium]